MNVGWNHQRFVLTEALLDHVRKVCCVVREPVRSTDDETFHCQQPCDRQQSGRIVDKMQPKALFHHHTQQFRQAEGVNAGIITNWNNACGAEQVT